eukprot:202194-Pyramimonas_sp.AAC.1
MHGNMRYDILPPTTPRKLTTTKHKSPPNTSDYDLRGHWIGVIIFGHIWVATGCVVGHTRGGDGTITTGPHWDLAGEVPFREFVRG